MRILLRQRSCAAEAAVQPLQGALALTPMMNDPGIIAWLQEHAMQHVHTGLEERLFPWAVEKLAKIRADLTMEFRSQTCSFGSSQAGVLRD